VETARSQEIVIIADTRDKPRWPGFGAAALDCGVHSMLCAPLWVDEQCFGTLTLFSAEPAAFSQQDIRLLELFTALALAEAQRAEQLREAIRSRDLIGQAKGILMERERIDDKTAFGRLVRASQDLNVKLVEVARHLSETGEFLGASSPDSLVRLPAGADQYRRRLRAAAGPSIFLDIRNVFLFFLQIFTQAPEVRTGLISGIVNVDVNNQY